jgi:hypothetical protein
MITAHKAVIFIVTSMRTSDFITFISLLGYGIICHKKDPVPYGR